MTPIHFYKGLRTLFGIRNGGNRYLCQTGLKMGRIELDINRFDEWLYEQCGEYGSSAGSMEDVVDEKYGSGAVSFIKKYM